METSNLPTVWWIAAGYLKFLITGSLLLKTSKRKPIRRSMRITEASIIIRNRQRTKTKVSCEELESLRGFTKVALSSLKVFGAIHTDNIYII